MFATFFNCAAIILGSLIGLLIAGKVREEYRQVIHVGAGITTLVLGMSMAFSSQKILYLALALLIGGILGTWWAIDAGILKLGHFLENLTLKRRIPKAGGAATETKEETVARVRLETERAANGWDFGRGFLNASVLFCVGAMALIGSFQAGTVGDYTMLLTKSILDGFLAILFAAAMGPGVAFSALPILVYQGSLTLAAGAISPYVSDMMLDELSGIGGALVLMIGINLLEIKEIKTANFLPALLLMAVLVLVDPFVLRLGAFLGIGG